MINAIKLENVSYKKQDHLILDSINFDIHEGEFVSVLGSVSSGKTILANIILGDIKDYNGNVYIFDKNIKDNNASNYISYISDEFNSFSTDKVFDELKYSLRNIKLSPDELYSKIEEISFLLDINDLLDLIPATLSNGQKVLVKLGCLLIKGPKVLIIDEAFDMLDGFTKEKVLKLLKKLSKKNNMTVIYITKNSNDTLYFDRIILLSNGNVSLDSKLKNAFNNEKLYREANIQFPFMVDLSRKLQYYDLVDNIEFNMDKLVNKLWK